MEKKVYMAPKMEQIAVKLEQSLLADSVGSQATGGSNQARPQSSFFDDDSAPVADTPSSSSIWD